MFGVDDQDSLFVEYDKGLIATSLFIDGLRKRFGFSGPDSEINAAWCAILKGPFPYASAIVRELKELAPRVVLLSNISESHHKYAEPLCTEFIPLFDECFYSYVIHKRKPDSAAFVHACGDSVLGQRILLVDDSAANCESAQQLGIVTLRVTDPTLTIENVRQRKRGRRS